MTQVLLGFAIVALLWLQLAHEKQQPDVLALGRQACWLEAVPWPQHAMRWHNQQLPWLDALLRDPAMR
jgi:hypothetical protein